MFDTKTRVAPGIATIHRRLGYDPRVETLERYTKTVEYAVMSAKDVPKESRVPGSDVDIPVPGKKGYNKSMSEVDAPVVLVQGKYINDSPPMFLIDAGVIPL